jgi:hypothetical protein
MGQHPGGRMNIAGWIMLAVMVCAVWSCLRSDWTEFDEQESADDEDEHSNPDSWGV